MEEFFVVLLGAFAVALAPLVPGLRPVAKAAVKGSLVLGEAASGVAVAAGQQWNNLTHKTESAQKNGGAAIVTGAEPMTASVPAAASVAPATRQAEAAESEAAPKLDQAQVNELARVDGIGSKTAELLISSGITSLAQLAATSVAGLREVLATAGGRYRGMDPSNWPDQARELIERE